MRSVSEVLRHLRAGIEHAGLDQESPGTGRQRAGVHSLRHSAARHWLTTAGIPLNVVSQWLGHATPEVTLRIYLPIVGSTPLHGGRAVGSNFELPFTELRSVYPL